MKQVILNLVLDKKSTIDKQRKEKRVIKRARVHFHKKDILGLGALKDNHHFKVRVRVTVCNRKKKHTHKHTLTQIFALVTPITIKSNHKTRCLI